MEIIKNFGLDPRLLIAQIVNFLIILYLLRRYLYKPMFSMLENRQKRIKEGVEQAEASKQLLEKAQKEEKALLKDAQKRVDVMLTDAKKQSQELLDTARSETKAQTDRMIKEAREQIARDSRQAEEKLTEQVSALAIDFLQKTLADIFSEKEQGEIMEKAIKVLKQKPN